MKINKMFQIFIAIGVASFAISYLLNPSRAWHGYLLSYYFVSSLALGGIFFVALQHLTAAGWSSTVRRIPESLIAWSPWAAITLVPLIIGGPRIYAWMRPSAVAHDPLLAMKTKYLNLPFFGIRCLIFFSVWYFIGGKMVKNSLRQDKEGGVELTNYNKKLSAIFIPLFALFFSFFSVDLVMSLDPHWYSTMFGVNCFANLFLSCLAVLVVIVVNMYRHNYFSKTVNENHIQNLGLLMFGFTVFYAYIAFSQFMLIWYGNLPEETQYYLKRWDHGWSYIAMAIVFVKFIIPFIGMLPRDSKRNPDSVIKWAYWLIFACWLDAYWMIMPNYSQTPVFPLYELGMLLGFVGGFGLTVQKFLNTHPVQPQKDPRVLEALHLHQ